MPPNLAGIIYADFVRENSHHAPRLSWYSMLETRTAPAKGAVSLL